MSGYYLQLAVVPVDHGDLPAVLGGRAPERLGPFPPIGVPGRVALIPFEKLSRLQVKHDVADNVVAFGILTWMAAKV